MAASSSKTDNPPPPPLCFYSLILDAIHTLYRLQTDLSFPLTRDQATEILTKILYKNQIPILEALQLFQAFEDTGKITLEDTFFFMMRQFFRSDSAVAIRVVQEQQDLIYQQEKKLSRFPKEEESLPVYNLVCNVCQKESQYVSASEFGRRVLQHIRGGDLHSAAMAENGGVLYNVLQLYVLYNAISHGIEWLLNLIWPLYIFIEDILSSKFGF